MNLSDVKKTHLERRRERRVGRGSGSGKGRTSGRGLKGQPARSGGPNKNKQLFDGGTTPLFRRLPKRGFSNGRFRKNCVVINVADLNLFAPGSEVNYDSLVNANLVASNKSKKEVYLKLLGAGELKVEKLKVKVHKASKLAKEQIEKAQGSVEIIPPKAKPKKWAKKRPASSGK